MSGGLGVGVIGRDDGNRATCESCHGMAPHPRRVNNKLNEHADRVACVTCHIPEYARGGKPTKIWWDWSTAGKKKPDGKPIKVKNKQGQVTYVTKKGDFEWGENLEPEYAWLSGKIRFRQLDEKIDPEAVTTLNYFEGSYKDENARIWPFKVMRGKQPYDTVNNSFLVSHLFGKDEAAFWKSFDWDKALRAGMAEAKAVGQTSMDYSGEFDFVETDYVFPITHMVAPKDNVLACTECHAKAGGRVSKLGGFYMPGRNSSNILDTIGWIVVIGSLLGVVLHGLGRMFTANGRKEK